MAIEGLARKILSAGDRLTGEVSLEQLHDSVKQFMDENGLSGNEFVSALEELRTAKLISLIGLAPHQLLRDACAWESVQVRVLAVADREERLEALKLKNNCM